MLSKTLISATLGVSITTLVLSCHSSNPATPTAATGNDTPLAKRRNLPMFQRNPETRAHVKKEPVAEYRVRTDNPLNEMYFTVRLYETEKTMRYLARIEFEGLTGEDTIKLPDLGTPPHPVLQKGADKYSCIIGLQDNDKNFRELKKVYVTSQGAELKITTLKHYRVTEGYRLASE